MAGFKLTYATMFNPPEELHTRFDAALAKVRADLGQEYSMLIGGGDRFASHKFESTNPANKDQILGFLTWFIFHPQQRHPTLPAFFPPERSRPDRADDSKRQKNHDQHEDDPVDQGPGWAEPAF